MPKIATTDSQEFSRYTATRSLFARPLEWRYPANDDAEDARER